MSNWHAAKISGRRRGTNGKQKRTKGKAKSSSAASKGSGSKKERSVSNKKRNGVAKGPRNSKPSGSRHKPSVFSRRPLIDNSSRYDRPMIEEKEDGVDDSVRCDVLQPIDPSPFFATISLGDPLANVHKNFAALPRLDYATFERHLQGLSLTQILPLVDPALASSLKLPNRLVTRDNRIHAPATNADTSTQSMVTAATPAATAHAIDQLISDNPAPQKPAALMGRDHPRTSPTTHTNALHDQKRTPPGMPTPPGMTKPPGMPTPPGMTNADMELDELLMYSPPASKHHNRATGTSYNNPIKTTQNRPLPAAAEPTLAGVTNKSTDADMELDELLMYSPPAPNQPSASLNRAGTTSSLTTNNPITTTQNRPLPLPAVAGSGLVGVTTKGANGDMELDELLMYSPPVPKQSNRSTSYHNPVTTTQNRPLPVASGSTPAGVTNKGCDDLDDELDGLLM